MAQANNHQALVNTLVEKGTELIQHEVQNVFASTNFDHEMVQGLMNTWENSFRNDPTGAHSYAEQLLVLTDIYVTLVANRETITTGIEYDRAVRTDAMKVIAENPRSVKNMVRILLIRGSQLQ